MKERIKGRKLLRLFLVCALGTALLSGCGGMNRYQTMELETETEAASGTEDMTVITMGETAAEEDGTEAGESSRRKRQQQNRRRKSTSLWMRPWW